ncbi:hypothetical protein DFH27DRAFT_21621 [Peziza echinospora]|nr:hypothetical protein DFH27DRAFT_21621 [Peziza echinospora]
MARFSLLISAAIVLLAQVQRTQGQELTDVLNNLGLTEYANFNNENPSGLEGSGSRTIFAPNNAAMEDLYSQSGSRRLSKAKRQNIARNQISLNQQQSGLQPPAGKTFYEYIPNTGLVVTSGNADTALGNSKVADPGSQPRQYDRRHTPAPSTEGPSYFAARYYSGAGRSSYVLQEGIRFNGGIIHVVNSVFALAVDIRDGIKEAGLGFYEAIFNRVPGYWSVVVNNPQVTVLLPSKDAIANASSTYRTTSSKAELTDAEWTKILDYGTITTGFVGYTPALVHNTTYRSRGGYFVVTWKAGEVYINDAKVIGRNNILNNGVIQVLDKVLFPPPLSAKTVPGPDGAVLVLDKKAADAAAGAWPYPLLVGNGTGNGTHNGTIPPPPSNGATSMTGPQLSGFLAGLAIVAALNVLF